VQTASVLSLHYYCGIAWVTGYC